MKLLTKEYKLNNLKKLIINKKVLIFLLITHYTNNTQIILKSETQNMYKVDKILFKLLLKKSIYNFFSNFLSGNLLILHYNKLSFNNFLNMHKNNLLNKFWFKLKNKIYVNTQLKNLSCLKYINNIKSFRNLLNLKFKLFTIMFFQLKDTSK